MAAHRPWRRAGETTSAQHRVARAHRPATRSQPYLLAAPAADAPAARACATSQQPRRARRCSCGARGAPAASVAAAAKHGAAARPCAAHAGEEVALERQRRQCLTHAGLSCADARTAVGRAATTARRSAARRFTPRMAPHDRTHARGARRPDGGGLLFADVAQRLCPRVCRARLRRRCRTARRSRQAPARRGRSRAARAARQKNGVLCGRLGHRRVLGAHGMPRGACAPHAPRRACVRSTHASR